MTVKNLVAEYEELAKIQVICPHCQKREFIQIPTKIVNESANVTTISIPSNYVCQHSFQIFVDKQFHIRGYQRVDFDISNLEIYSDRSDSKEDLLITYNSSVIIKKLIELIRENIAIKGIFGGLVLTDTGNLIFSSLPSEISFTMINKLGLEKYYSRTINQVFLTFTNNQKVISAALMIDRLKLLFSLFLSAEVDYNAANYYLLELRKNLLLLSTIDFNQNSYWIHSIITPNSLQSEEFFLDSIGIKIQKSVVKNADEIEETLRKEDYNGKVIINERYVKLLGGLLWTVYDAIPFYSNLNL